MNPDADLLIGWVHRGDVHTGFMDSMLRTFDYDRYAGQRIAGWYGVQCSANISAGRNKLVDWFLGCSTNWLMMIDTDMLWPADAIARLLQRADPVDAPIVGGLCFAREADTGVVWPTLLELEPLPLVESTQFYRFRSWPADTLFRVDGTGAGFLLVHRAVFETIRERRFSNAFPWFQETENAAGRVSEDLTFCLRAHECGIPVHVHTGVQVGHIKPHVVTVHDYQAQQALLAERDAAAGGAGSG